MNDNTQEVKDPFIETFNKKFNDYIQKKKKVFAHDFNRVSDIYHAFMCLRMYVYKRLFWREAGLPSDELQKIFIKGEESENADINFIQEKLNIVIYRWDQDEHLLDEGHKFRGTPDFFMKIEVEDGVFIKRGIDGKSVSGNIFPTITDAESIKNSKHFWHRAYYYQAQGYCGLSGEKNWILLFSNKQSRDFKLVNISFDPEYYQQILDKCDEVNSWVERFSNIQALKDELNKLKMDGVDALTSGGNEDDLSNKIDLIEKELSSLGQEMPDRITYDPDICDNCDFNHLCKPRETFIEGLLDNQITDETIIEEIKWMEELKPKASEYRKLKDKYKKFFTDMSNVLIGGDYEVLRDSAGRMYIRNIATGKKV